MDALREAVYFGTNEEHLMVYTDPIKGRGVKAGRCFVKNEFVVEYKGKHYEKNLLVCLYSGILLYYRRYDGILYC